MTARYSKQREAVLGYVKSVTCHPTADEVYLNVRQELPNISLGTVYRNLSLLVSQGEIDIVKAPNNADRFDGNTDEHDHVVCRKCGTVSDIFELQHNYGIDEDAERLSGYKQIRHRLIFSGMCPECAK